MDILPLLPQGNSLQIELETMTLTVAFLESSSNGVVTIHWTQLEL